MKSKREVLLMLFVMIIGLSFIGYRLESLHETQTDPIDFVFGIGQEIIAETDKAKTKK